MLPATAVVDAGRKLWSSRSRAEPPKSCWSAVISVIGSERLSGSAILAPVSSRMRPASRPCGWSMRAVCDRRLPYMGQIVWRACFDGVELAMQSMFDAPRPAQTIIETYTGCLALPCRPASQWRADGRGHASAAWRSALHADGPGVDRLRLGWKRIVDQSWRGARLRHREARAIIGLLQM